MPLPFPRVMLLALIPLLPACSAPATFGNAPAVRVESEKSATFSQFKTYTFLPGQLNADPGRVRMTSEELDRRVESALRPRMETKGLRPAGEAAQPDLYVTYRAAIRSDAEIVSAGRARSPGGYDEPGAIAPGAEWGVRKFEEGTLILTFNDARTSLPVWQATVAAEVAEGSRAVERALDAALKRYPPSRK